MEFLRRSWSQVLGFLGQLGPTERWLIGALAIILIFVGSVVVQYAGKPTTVPLTGFSAERAGVVLGKLRERGIDAVMEAGQVRVPQDQWAEALVALEQSDLLATDLVSAFDQMVAHQSVWTSSSQRDREFLVAKQKVLSAVIGRMKGVKSAVVVIDVPRQDRFARATRPSASVSLTLQGAQAVDRGLVESVAGLVSGAVVDMKAQDVVVIDANAGRRYSVKDEIDQLPEEAWQMVRKLEQHHREKIEEMLGYIPGVIVAVSVRTDSVTRKVVKTREFAPEPLKRQTEEETETKDTRPAGRAGARANTESEIGGSTGETSTSKTSRTETEYADKPVTIESDSIEAGHKLKQVSVTVNVPRSYFVNLLRQGGGAPRAEPDAAAVEQLAQKELKDIAAQVEPHINTAETDGVVRTHMINDSIQRAVLASAGAAPTGMAGLFQSDWARPVGLGAMGLMALGLMFGMVRKATTQSADLPSVEELAGVPPTLPSDDDLVGEAEESENTMEGVELDREELRYRQLNEQIAELVKSRPDDAASLLGKWVRVDD